MDKRTGLTDKVQLAIFVPGIDGGFNVTEKLLSLYSLKGQTRGVDILQALKNVLQNNGFELENLSGVATHGAPFTIGKHSGLIDLLKKKDKANNAFANCYNCIIHQENY